MKVNLICDANETTWSNFNEDWFISDLFFMFTLRHFKQTFWGQVLKGWVCDNLLYVCIRTEVWKDNKSEETRTLLQWRGHVSLKIRHAKSDLGTIHIIRKYWTG